MRGCGEARTEGALQPQGFEECRKPLTTACGLQPLQEGPTDRVIQSLAVTAWYICLPKACPVLCLPLCPMAKDGFTAEGRTAIRQRSQGGWRGKPVAFPLPSCCPYLQHPVVPRHHSLRWTSRLDSSFLQGFHSWCGVDVMKVLCGLQSEQSIPSLSCHVMVRPDWRLLPQKDWASQKAYDYFPRECIKP